MTRRIKAIFIDLDDTLVPTSHIDGAAYARVCATASRLAPGLNEAQLIADWRKLFKAEPWDPAHQVEVEQWRAGLWRRALAAQGHDSTEAGAELQQIFSSMRLQLFQFGPGVEELLGSLAQQGYTLVIITNGHHVVQRQKIASCQAHRLVPHILVGGEEVREGRHEKPHPGIFQRACELAQCQPQEAIHVGDSLRCDVAGGCAAGLCATVWVNAACTEGKLPPPGSPQPDFVIQNVLELPGVLERLEK